MLKCILILTKALPWKRLMYECTKASDKSAYHVSQMKKILPMHTF